MTKPSYPRSLFTRLVLLLLSGLILSEVITALLLTSDRSEVIQRASGIYSAQRIAGIVKILDKQSPAQRLESVKALDAPGMRLSLSLPPEKSRQDRLSTNNTLFLRVLRYYLDDNRTILFSLTNRGNGSYFAPHEGMPMAMGDSGMQEMMRKHMAEAGLLPSSDGTHLIQVQLHDGQWVSFGEQLPQKITVWSMRLIFALGLVLITLSLVAFLAVRWIIRPLSHLAASARALGQNLQRPPLEVAGPNEVQDTLQAFNAMQQQIRQYVDERSRFLASISHDLKTPITRLRLRSGLLDDEVLQAKFERDLDEMEDLVQGILEFMRDETGQGQKKPLDINDLLETLQIDGEESGAAITLQGRAQSAFYCHPVSMRRLITNLVENALKYGGQADIEVVDEDDCLIIRIGDKGRGIPESALERVFEPFTRLDDSRSRETGGSGLGLSIAKNIAVAHGGSLTLENRKDGGLMAEVRLPRKAKTE